MRCRHVTIEGLSEQSRLHKTATKTTEFSSLNRRTSIYYYIIMSDNPITLALPYLISHSPKQRCSVCESVTAAEYNARPRTGISIFFSYSSLLGLKAFTNLKTSLIHFRLAYWPIDAIDPDQMDIFSPQKRHHVSYDSLYPCQHHSAWRCKCSPHAADAPIGAPTHLHLADLRQANAQVAPNHIQARQRYVLGPS
jgi:hypothetical protein